MQKIKMIDHGFGSDVEKNGVTAAPKNYEKGKEYEVSDYLADVFVNQLKLATPVKETPKQAAPVKPAPENKMQKESAANKNKESGPAPEKK